MDRRICSFFPGLLTPDLRLLQACLDSYGTPADGGRGWILRPEDDPASRAEELKGMRGSLAGLGARMGFFVEDEREMYWTDTSGRKYCFVFTGSAAVGRYLLQPVFDADRSWLVLPGGRAVLVGFKLKGNVLLRRAVAERLALPQIPPHPAPARRSVPAVRRTSTSGWGWIRLR